LNECLLDLKRREKEKEKKDSLSKIIRKNLEKYAAVMDEKILSNCYTHGLGTQN